MSGGKFLANIALKMERKGVGIVAQTLVYVPKQFALDRIQINRNALNCIAPAIKIAEHVPA